MKRPIMKGIHFLANDTGRKTAIQIDLRIHAALGEDLHDILLAQSRDKEPRESLKAVKTRLKHRLNTK